MLVRIELGVVSRGHLEPAEIVSEYIRDNQTDKVYMNVIQIDWLVCGYLQGPYWYSLIMEFAF